MALFSLCIALLLAALARATVVQLQPTSRGAMMDVWLGPGPGPHPAWKVNKCWHWDASAAPYSQHDKLTISFCRSLRVPKPAVYHIIADTSAPANSADSLGIVRVLKEGKLRLWRHCYYEHEKSAHRPIKMYMRPGIDYTVCFTGRKQSFDLCGIELYSCFSDLCKTELQHHAIMSLSRRSR